MDGDRRRRGRQRLLENVTRDGRASAYRYGDLLQRLICHYWYHTGENMAIRQQLGHARLQQFVGDIDGKAPYRPDAPDHGG